MAARQRKTPRGINHAGQLSAAERPQSIGSSRMQARGSAWSRAGGDACSVQKKASVWWQQQTGNSGLEGERLERSEWMLHPWVQRLARNGCSLDACIVPSCRLLHFTCWQAGAVSTRISPLSEWNCGLQRQRQPMSMGVGDKWRGCQRRDFGADELGRKLKGKMHCVSLFVGKTHAKDALGAQSWRMATLRNRAGAEQEWHKAGPAR